jgi:phosphoglycerol transferase
MSPDPQTLDGEHAAVREDVAAAPAAPAEPAPDPARSRPPWRFDVVLSSLAGVLALVLTVPILHLWQADLQVPFAYSGDANSHGMLVKAVLDHGWYERNPNLGAPFVQHFNDFPMPDNLHLVAARVLGLFFHSYGAVLNLYFLGGFGLAAFFAALVLRSLKVSRSVALCMSLLYAFAPYHFIRGEAQLFLASYYAVPLGVYVALGVLGHVELFPKRRGATGPVAYLSWGSAATLGMCVLVGSSSAYYGAFAVILVGVVVVIPGLGNRDLRALAVGLVVAGAITATVGANVAPDVLWSRSHGENTNAVVRAPGDTETYSLKLTQLLLPSQQHRLPQLASVSARYLRVFPIPSEPHPIGAVAAFGVLASLAVLATTVLGGGGARTGDRGARSRRLAVHVGFLTLTSLLVAMTGGLSSLFELLVIPILRGWNRIAIFVAFLGLIATSLLLERLRGRWFDRRPALFGLVVLAVLGVGLFDQTSPQFVPDYAGNRGRFQSDADFVHRIESTLPKGSMVFQLPFVPFPEAGPLHGMVDYDHFRGYLHSKDLRWSYGGLQGRPESDWAGSVAVDDPAAAMTRLASVGFGGVYIDRAGYVDEGHAIETALTQLLGSAPIVSRDGRLSFFDLRDFRETVLARDGSDVVAERRREELAPVGVSFEEGFFPQERFDQTVWRWAGTASRLRLVNPEKGPRTVNLDLRAATRGASPSTLVIEAPGRPAMSVPVNGADTDVALRVTLPPGTSNVRFHSDAPDSRDAGESRDLRIRLINLHVSPATGSDGEGAP